MISKIYKTTIFLLKSGDSFKIYIKPIKGELLSDNNYAERYRDLSVYLNVHTIPEEPLQKYIMYNLNNVVFGDKNSKIKIYVGKRNGDVPYNREVQEDIKEMLYNG